MEGQRHLPLVPRQEPCLEDCEANLDDCVHDLGGVDGANLEGRHRFLFVVLVVHH